MLVIKHYLLLRSRYVSGKIVLPIHMQKKQIEFHIGISESNNNRLSTILKMAYGYHNFKRFRDRALLILSVEKI